MIQTVLMAFVFGLFTHLAHADEKTHAAVVAAKAWHTLVDSKEYKKSWEEAALFFKERVKEEQWFEIISAVRKPLGKMESRQLISAVHKTSLPGVPDGEYVVIQFKTTYSEKREAVETITPMKVNGTWRVSGYFIK